MASLSVVLFQILYPFAAILVYVFLQKLNEKRKQKARDELQLKLDRQKEQQPEVQYRGDSATDSVGALPESSRIKDSAAHYDVQQLQPTLPQSVFKPEPTMLELPSLPYDWEIKPEQLVISKRPDGSPWELGTGAFGKVSCCSKVCRLLLGLRQQASRLAAGFQRCPGWGPDSSSQAATGPECTPATEVRQRNCNLALLQKRKYCLFPW